MQRFPTLPWREFGWLRRGVSLEKACKSARQNAHRGMKTLLFCGEFYRRDKFFGLCLPGEVTYWPPGVELEFEPSEVVHFVCGDPQMAAFLAGLIVLQAWTYGIGEDGMPLPERRPLLVLTDKPGRFGEAFLQLRLPIDQIELLCRRRRVRLYEKTGRAGTDAASYWENRVRERDPRNRFHNFFPAYVVIRSGAEPKPISDREFLGRADAAGPAVLISRCIDREAVTNIITKYRPFFLLIHSENSSAALGSGLPTVICHDSIFAPEISAVSQDAATCRCLPDRAFEDFCQGSHFNVLQPELPPEAARLLSDADGALVSLSEELAKQTGRLVRDVARTALRLRTLLWGLPLGVEAYEQGLVLSQLRMTLQFDVSVNRLFEALRGRIPEMTALGEWYELIIQVLVEDMDKLIQLLAQQSPKRAALMHVIRDAKVRTKRRPALVVDSEPLAAAIRHSLAFPAPAGLGELANDVAILPVTEISQLEPGQACVISGAFEPEQIFPPLSRSGPHPITAILYPGELRFLRARLERARDLFPTHPAVPTLILPMLSNIGAADPKMRSLARLQASGIDLGTLLRSLSRQRETDRVGTILTDMERPRPDDRGTTVRAHVVELESDERSQRMVVLLTKDARVSYVRDDDSICTGSLLDLQPGDRLIRIDPVLRESLREKIFSANPLQQTEPELQAIAERWRAELVAGIRAPKAGPDIRESMTHAEVLSRIRARGSTITNPATIGHWARGTVHGPQDINDILRVGQAIGSEWLMNHWRKVGLALIAIRSGSISLGHQITKLIQRAALGDLELSADEQQFLEQTGITMGELQDAATLVTVSSVSPDTTEVARERVGNVFVVDAVQETVDGDAGAKRSTAPAD